MNTRFFRCAVCGNIVMKVEDSGVNTVCCGEQMKELIAGTTEASQEKHIPVCEVNGNKVTVTVGSALHPSEEKHYIQWIGIETDTGVQIKKLKAGMKPQACFCLCENDRLHGAFAYCNIHSLWATDVK